MGFFDFLKDVGFKAPEPEPQRGTLIQTDNKGRIATTPIGTPNRPVSRIVSRDEFRDMQDTSQGRSFEQAQEDLSPEQKMLALSRQPTTPFAIRSFGPPSARANVPSNALQILRDREDAQGGIATVPRNIYRDMDAQRQRVSGIPAVNTSNISLPQRKPIIIPPMSKPIVPYDQENEGDDPNDVLQRMLNQRASGLFNENDLTTDESPALVNQYAEDAYEMRNDAVIKRTNDLSPQEMMYRMNEIQEQYGVDPVNLASKEFLNRGGVEPTPENEKTLKDYLSNLWKSRYTTESAGFDEIGGDKNFPPSSVNRTTGYMHQQPEFLQSGNFGARRSGNFGARANVPDATFNLAGGVSPQEDQLGGNMVGIGKNVPAYTTQAYTGSQPKQGISSFADAKQEIKKGKDSGIKDLNFLQKIMALARNPIGRVLGHETDEKGMLTMKGLADMEANKQFAMARNAELQRDRQKDRERKERAMMGQQTPIDPCPTGFTFDPSTQSCVADASQEEETSSLYGRRNPMSRQEYMNQFRRAGETGDVPLTQYGRRGGEYKYYLRDGGPPKQDTGVVRGAGGPKDDLVGPVMLSNTEYVLPTEQVSMYGGGNYQTGLKRLENDRIKALNNFA